MAGKKMPKANGEVSAGLVGDNLYVFGNRPSTTFAYNVVTDLWSYGPTRPYAGNHQVAFVVGNEVYVLGGFQEGSEKMTQVYSPSNYKWTIAPYYPGIGLGSYVGAGIDGCLYVCSGLYYEASKLFDEEEVLNRNPNDCFRYDTYAQSWTQFANILVGVNHAASGTCAFHPRPPSCYHFLLPSFPYSLFLQLLGFSYMIIHKTYTHLNFFCLFFFFLAGTDGERFFVFGGRTSTYNLPGNAIAAVQIYDIASNTWRLGPEMPIPKSGCGAAPFVNGKFYIFGGSTGVPFENNRIFPW